MSTDRGDGTRGWRLRQAVHSGGLLAGLGAVVWATGFPVVFPSLGPTAYLLATRPEAPTCAPRRVIGGHAIGVLAGLPAAHLLAGPAVLTATPAPGSLGALRLAVAGVLAVAATTAGMLATDTGHAPACATTLIVALGILSRPVEAVVMLLAVLALQLQHELLVRI